MNSNKIIIYFILSAIFLSGTFTMTAHAASTQEPLMFFCANNPISKKYYVDGVTAGDIMGGCKEKLDGYSWGSRIYILIYSPGFNSDPNKIDVIGNNNHTPITANSREGSMSLAGDGCNGFIETAPDHGLFFGSVKLSGFRHDINGDGSPDLYGGNRCEKNYSVLDDGSGRVEAKQDGGVTVNFEWREDELVSKTALYSWREATLEFDKTEYDVSDEIQLTLTDLDNMRWPFDRYKISYPVHVYSDTDLAGIVIDAYWVPNYKGIVQMNGHYPIKLNLTFDDESYESSAPYGNSHGLLRVAPGDTIYAKYTDYSLPKPYSIDDQKQIVSTAKVNDLVDVTNPLEVSAEITDSNGTPLHHCVKGESIKIKTNVLNTKDEVVSAYIITQIKDSNNVIQHLSWSAINIIPGKTSNINSELIMENDGVHTFEIFILDNLGNPNSFSKPLTIVI